MTERFEKTYEMNRLKQSDHVVHAALVSPFENKLDYRRISTMLRVVLQIVTAAIFGGLCIAAEACGDGPTARSGSGFEYPRPTGRFQVGTSYLFLEDSTRFDTFSDDPEDYRWISLRVWYPASPPTGATPAPYGDDEFNRLMVEEGIFDSTYLDEVALRPSASFRDVPLASQGAPWPILIYSSSGVITANVFLFEELASHGYVVLAVGHPYWCEFYFDGEGELFYFDKSNRHYVAMLEEEDATSTKETKEQITRSADAEEKMALFKKLNQLMPTEVADLALWQDDIDFLIDLSLSSTEGRGSIRTVSIRSTSASWNTPRAGPTPVRSVRPAPGSGRGSTSVVSCLAMWWSMTSTDRS